MNAIVPFQPPRQRKSARFARYNTLKDEAEAHYENYVYRLQKIVANVGDPDGRDIQTICRDDHMDARTQAIADRCIEELDEVVIWGENLLDRFDAAGASWSEYRWVELYTDEARTLAYDMRTVLAVKSIRR